jgi:VWFA-related protein
LLRIRFCACLSVLCVVLLCAVGAWAQEEQPTATLQLSSKLVLVPAQVQTKSGEMIYGLKPEQFRLEDDGVQQQIKLDEDTDALGLSLVVVVECSRKAYEQFDNMRGLASLVDELTGGPNDEVAMISYGTEIEQLTGFTRDEKKLAQAYTDLQPCDDEKDATTLDAVEAADRLFAKAPVTNRHAILLIGETRDHGSKVRTAQVVADLNRTNVVVDAVSFNPGKDDLLAMLGGSAPNPKEFLMLVVNAVRRNVPHTLASATGGEYTNFNTQKKFEKGVQRLTNKIHNYYLLSFQQPSTAEPGLHRLKLSVPDYSNAKLRYRLMYYAGDAPVPDVPEDKADDADAPDKGPAKPPPPPR